MDDATLGDEEGRLAALDRYDVLDSAPEAPFENIVSLVRAVLAVPVATVTLVARERQWFKAKAGFTETETPREISICTHTIAGRGPLVVPDLTADPRFADNPLVTRPPHIRSYAGVPLATHDGYNVGTLCAIDMVPRAFSGGDIAMLENFAGLVVGELELRQIAQSDQLTGALTRRGFLAAAEQEIERGARYGRPSTLVLLDVDRFKSVNDTHGHPAGDAVLRMMAGICEATLRPNDVLGRVGGEEFGILLPETSAEDGLAAAERIRLAIERAPFPIARGAVLRITGSFGLAALTPEITTPEQWLAAADAPLYAAKRQGRNQCRVAGPNIRSA